ncbi:coiled-coil domain-containing protein 160 [Mantella aurantiaca]
MEDKKKHWVEELFAPRFTAQDLFYDTLEPDLLLSEKLAKSRATKVEGIYQAALSKLQEDERQKRKENLSKLIIQDYESYAQKSPATAQSTTHASCPKTHSNSTDTADDINTCIWTEHELNLLRHEMNKKHNEGTRLKLQLDAYKLELSELKAKRKESDRELEAVRAELAASKRYAECKHVLVKQMQKDDDKKDAELQFLKKDLQDKAAMLHHLAHSYHKAKKEMQDMQMRNTDLEHELKSLRQQQGLDNIFAVENMKLKFSRKVNKLREEIESIKAEGGKQRGQVARDQGFLGFNH